MDAQTISIRLQANNPAPISFSAYNARTLIIACVGSVTGADLLRAELHESRIIGATPLAAVEIETPTDSVNLLEFSAVEMNQLPGNDVIEFRKYWLVIYTRTGSGDDAVRSTVAFASVKLLANPGSDVPAPEAETSPYITAAEAAALIFPARFVSATLLTGNDTVSVTLAAGEKVAGVSPQDVCNLQYLYTTYSGLTATLQFSSTADIDIPLLLTVRLS